jgi:hypothetical protein
MSSIWRYDGFLGQTGDVDSSNVDLLLLFNLLSSS